MGLIGVLLVALVLAFLARPAWASAAANALLRAWDVNGTLSKALHTPVELGTVSDLSLTVLGQRVALEGIRVQGRDFTVRRIEVNAQMLGMIWGAKPKVEVLVDQPHVAVRLDTKGKLNWDFPKGQDKKQEGGEPPNIWAHLVLKGGRVDFQDAKKKFEAQVALSTEAKLDKQVLSASWGLSSPGIRLTGDLVHPLKKGEGTAHLDIDGQDLFRYLAYAVPQVPVKQSSLSIKAAARWDGAKFEALTADATLNGQVKAHLPHPVRAKGKVRYADKRVQVEPVILHYDQAQAVVRGRVDLQGKKPKLDVKVATNHLELGRLAKSFVKFPLQGGARLQTEVTGLAENPQVTGRLTLDRVAAYGIQIPAADLRFDASKEELNVKELIAQVADGRMVSHGRLSLAGQRSIDGHLAATGLSIKRFPGFAKTPSGTVSADLTFSGTTQNPGVKGDITLRSAWGDAKTRLSLANDQLKAQLTARLKDIKHVQKGYGGAVTVEATASGHLKQLQKNWKRALVADATVRTGAVTGVGLPIQGVDVVLGYRQEQAKVRATVLAPMTQLKLTGGGNPFSQQFHAVAEGQVRQLGALLPGRDLTGSGQLWADVSYKRGGVFGKATAGLQRLKLAEVAVPHAQVKVSLLGGKVAIDSAEVKAGGGHVRMAGTYDWKNGGKLDLKGRLYQTPIQSLMAMLPKTKKETYTAAPQDRQVAIHTLPRSQTVPLFTGDFQDSKGNLQLDLLPILRYWSYAHWPPATEENLAQAKQVSPLQSIVGNLTGSFRIGGSQKRPLVESDLLVSDMELWGNPFPEGFLTAKYDAGDVQVSRLVIRGANGGHLVGSGHLKTNQAMHWELEGTRLPVSLINPWTRPFGYRFQGRMNLLLAADGTPKKPKATVSIEVDEGKLNEGFFDKFSTLVELENDVLDIAHASLGPSNRQAVVAGRLPLSPEGEMNLTMKAADAGMGLMSLFTDKAEWVGGGGSALVTIKGTSAKPEIYGRIQFNGSKIFLPGVRETIERLDGVVTVNNQKIEMKDLVAVYNGGPIDIQGDIDLLRFQPAFLNLKAKAERVAIRRPGQYEGDVAFDLKIKNLVYDPIISGKVTLLKGETNVKIGGSGSSGGGGGSASSSRAFQLANLKVTLSDDYWVKTPVFNIQPHGTLALTWKTDQPIVISGTLESSKGDLQLLNNNFKIRSMKADFIVRDFDRDVSPINPRLDITAEAKIPNPRPQGDKSVNVVAQIAGDLSNLQREEGLKITWLQTGGLSSSEIYSVIGGGQALVDASSGRIDRIASGFSPLLEKTLLGPVTDQIAEFLELDDVNLGLASSSLSDPALSVSFTKPLFGGLSLGFSRIFATSPRSTYTLRYRINDNWSLRYSFDDPELIHNFRAETGYRF